MKLFTFTKLGRTLLLTVALVMGLIGIAAAQQKGTFTDRRDGKAYRAVRIGKQVWMAENLNYKTGNSWCYENNDSKCEQYGRLYDWETAMTACPAGWHLPSGEEWDNLVTAAGDGGAGKVLKSVTGWEDNGNGTDVLGFSALPGGLRNSHHYFDVAGYGGVWWTTDEDYDGVTAYFRGMRYNSVHVKDGDDGKNIGFSVRCIKD